MRVLLLGELSGFHQELKPGLERAGVEVVAAHSRLAYPDFPSDVGFYRPPAKMASGWTRLRDVGSQVWHASELTGFDIVQIVTPKFFDWRLHGSMLRYLKRNNGALVAINLACTSDYHRRVAQLRYSPCADCKAFDLKSDACIYDRDDEHAAENLTWDLADRIVSTHFDYDWAMRDTRHSAKLVQIPLAVDTHSHRPAPMPAGKVRIWYGETRFGFKGGRFIREALDRMAGDSAVEVVQTHRLPFRDYLDLLDTVHVLIDQASFFGPGMSALYGMARGKVVLTGAEPENDLFVGGTSPAINIEPDADDIYRKLVRLINDPELIRHLGAAATRFVQEYHSSDVIGRRYAAMYNELR